MLILKAFTEKFYWKVTGSHLQPVLDTIEYIYHEAIPGWTHNLVDPRSE